MTDTAAPSDASSTPLSRRIDAVVPGRPAPQGSKRYLGRGVMVESSSRVPSWRADVRDALDGLGSVDESAGVELGVDFVLPRPKSLRAQADPPAVKRNGDLDKLVRAVMDAVTSAGTWSDDCVVTRIVASKRIARPGERPGATIRIMPARAPASSSLDEAVSAGDRRAAVAAATAMWTQTSPDEAMAAAAAALDSARSAVAAATDVAREVSCLARTAGVARTVRARSIGLAPMTLVAWDRDCD